MKLEVYLKNYCYYSNKVFVFVFYDLNDFIMEEWNVQNKGGRPVKLLHDNTGSHCFYDRRRGSESCRGPAAAAYLFARHYSFG